MRLEPKSVDDMRPEWVATLQRIPGDGLKGRFAPRHVLGMLMHNPSTLGAFLDHWVSSKLDMGFTVREQELVILRMALHYDCNYVWKHHVPVAEEFGVTQAELDAVREQPLGPVFSDRETALLALTDEMVLHRNVGDAAWSKYKPELTDSEVIDLISLVSQYVLFSLANNVLRVEVERNLDEIEPLYPGM
ncbi:carboxymuconolactone decarboxylase family protein [Flavobacteriales bacterium]|nr:carboxymuconolactone decarboxylase family protein [Flavobacteriales bacterium]